MDLTFVTSNPGKLREVRAVLRPYGIAVRWSRRRLPELQSDSLEKVVRGKLRAVPAGSGRVLVEDSGLFIDALGGFPGVYSAHILALWGFGPILELLRSRPRGASFRTVAALRWGSSVRLFRGEVRGTIARAARGRHGFGFDPIFEPEGERRTFAEMSPEEKDALSHRGRAMARLGRSLARGPHRVPRGPP